MKRRRMGALFLLLGLLTFGLLSGAAHNHHDEAYETYRRHHTTVAGEGLMGEDVSAENGFSSEDMVSRESHHRHRGHHRGGFLKPLILLGGLFVLLKAFKHKRHGGGKHRHHGPRSVKDEEADIADAINLNPDATPNPPVDTSKVDGLTEEDLLLAMKRLGIKKLEL